MISLFPSSAGDSDLAPYQRLCLPQTPPRTPRCDAAAKNASAKLKIFDSYPQRHQNGQVRPVVAVIGTGYVGLHLVEAFSVVYDVIAFDVSEERLKEIQPTLPSNIIYTTNASDLVQATHFLVSVNTAIDNQRRIDTSCLQAAVQAIEKHARPGSTVVIESSVAVGMTRDLLSPLVHLKNLRCGMSPERVDPGRTYPHYTTIPKIISGLDAGSLQSIQSLYSRVFANLVVVSSTEVAEMTKLYENCQRMVCIAYANEMADACVQLSRTLSECQVKRDGSKAIIIDPLEVSRAAATKPFGYMPFTPSLGVGGHCIPCNPFYLLSIAEFPLLETCTTRMRERPARIGDRLMRELECISTGRPRILIVGLGFKRGQSVLSHSPGLALATHLLSNYNVHVEYADPLVDQSAVRSIPKMEGDHWNVQSLQQFDYIVVAVDQPGLDLSLISDVEAQGTLVEWFCSPQKVAMNG